MKQYSLKIAVLMFFLAIKTQALAGLPPAPAAPPVEPQVISPLPPVDHHTNITVQAVLSGITSGLQSGDTIPQPNVPVEAPENSGTETVETSNRF